MRAPWALCRRVIQLEQCANIHELDMPGTCSRHVGVTNFDVHRLKEIVDSGVRIVSNQVLCTSAQCFCQEAGSHAGATTRSHSAEHSSEPLTLRSFPSELSRFSIQSLLLRIRRVFVARVTF